MVTKTRKTRRQARPKLSAIPGLAGVRIIERRGERKLELRDQLDMPREVFSRLVNVSVRTIAKVEADQAKVAKLQRPYVEVDRLFDALSEVVEPKCLGQWFVTPNKALDGLKPIEVIERGEIDRLWDMVYRLRSGVPG